MFIRFLIKMLGSLAVKYYLKFLILKIKFFCSWVGFFLLFPYSHYCFFCFLFFNLFICLFEKGVQKDR